MWCCVIPGGPAAAQSIDVHTFQDRDLDRAQNHHHLQHQAAHRTSHFLGPVVVVVLLLLAQLIPVGRGQSYQGLDALVGPVGDLPLLERMKQMELKVSTECIKTYHLRNVEDVSSNFRLGHLLL